MGGLLGRLAFSLTLLVQPVNESLEGRPAVHALARVCTRGGVKGQVLQ